MSILDSLNDFLNPEKINLRNVWEVMRRSLPDDLPVPAFFVETSKGHHDGIHKIDLVPFDRYGRTDSDLILYTYALLDYRFPGRLHYNVSPKGCHHIHLDITKPISRRKEITTGSNPCTVIVTQPDARDFKSNPVPGYRLLSKAESLKNPVINDLVSIRAATKEAYKQTGMFRRVDYVPTVLMLGAVLILLSTQDYSKDQKKKG